jgi:Holliday junction resolvasome RuvABC endonuclease subunit
MPQDTSTLWIGIDPSATSTGIAFISEGKLSVVRVQPRDLRGSARLAFLRNRFNREFELNKQDTIYACIEGPAFDACNKADTLGQVRGIFLLALEDAGATITVVPPTTLKKFATKHGNASKESMIAAAYTKWHRCLQEDEADAAWLAQLAFSLSTNNVDTRAQLEVLSGIRSPKTKPVVRFKHKTNV